MLGSIDILDSKAVTRHPSVSESIMFAKDVLKKVGIGTRGHSIYSVIRTHDGASVGIANAALEGWGVVFRKILCRNDRVVSYAVVAVPCFEVVSSEVLASGNDL